MNLIVLGVAALVALVLFFTSVRIVKQWERGVVYRLGRVTGAARQPGLRFVIPLIERMEKVMVAVVALELEPQQVITKDNVSLAIKAVVYFRVNDAVKAEVEVDDYEDAVSLRGQSVLRQVIGASMLDDVLAHNAGVAVSIKDQLAGVAAAWGLDVQSVELLDVELPEGMRRAMAAQAEAARMAQAKVAEAQGEKNSALLLREAADILGESGTALRLRELQVLQAIGTEQGTVIVMDSHSGAIAAQSAAGQIAGVNNAS